MDLLNRIYSSRRSMQPLLAATVIVLAMTACAPNPDTGTNPDSIPSGAATSDTINEGSGPAESTP
ncbi:MAG: hypothetical protein H7Y22_07270 [Gemmatimonadaceae bacterium]|nr:hypothetical protein [Gloeobacterales cyanobacterium ES-bin-141]